MSAESRARIIAQVTGGKAGPITKSVSTKNSKKIKLPSAVTSTSPKAPLKLNMKALDAMNSLSGDELESFKNVHDDVKLQALGLLNQEKGLTAQAKALGINEGDLGEANNEGAVSRVFDVLQRPLYGVGNAFANAAGRDQDTTTVKDRGADDGWGKTLSKMALSTSGIGGLIANVLPTGILGSDVANAADNFRITPSTATAAVKGLKGEEKTTFSKMYLEDMPKGGASMNGKKDGEGGGFDLSWLIPNYNMYHQITGNGPAFNVGPETLDANKSTLAATAIGGVSDMALDPVSYIGAGAVKDAGTIAIGGGKAAKAGEVIPEAGEALVAAKDAIAPVEEATKAATLSSKAAGTATKVKDATTTTSALNTAKNGLYAPRESMPASKSVWKNIVGSEPILATGKVGDSAKGKITRAAMKDYKVAAEAAGVDTTTAKFTKELTKVGKAAVETEKTEAFGRIAESREELNALLKAQNVKIQLKAGGHVVAESEKLGKALQKGNKLFEATKAGKLLRESFIPGAKIGDKELHNIQRLASNVSAAQYEETMKEIKSAFTGGEVGGEILGKTTKQDRKLITHAIEAGNINALPPKLHPHFKYVQGQFEKLAKAEGISAKELKDNYVYHVYRNKRSLPRFGPEAVERTAGLGSREAKKAKFSTIQAAKDKGARPVEDIADILAHRTAKSYREQSQAEMFDYIGQQFGVKAPGKARLGQNLAKMEEQGVAVSGKKIEGLTGFDNVYFDPEVAEVLTKMKQSFAREPVTQQWAKLIDKVTAKMKFVMTAPNPGFHMRNMVSDTYMNFLDGVTDPRRYDQALAVLGHGTNRNRTIMEVFGHKLDAADINRLYDEAGLRTGFYHAETNVAGANIGNKFTSGVRNFSETREDWTRMAHFIDSLEDEVGKGAKTLEEATSRAGARVKKWNFDYGDLTEFERNVMKRIIPFYTFMRKNIPRQLESLAIAPGRVSAAHKAQGALANAILGPQDPDEPLPNITGAIPEWLREMGPSMLQGETGQQDPVFMSPDMPYQQAGQFLGGFTKGPEAGVAQAGKEAISSFNPLGKIPVELAMGRDISTGAPKDRDLVDAAIGTAPFARNVLSDKDKDSEHVSPTFTLNVGGTPVEVPEKWVNYFSGAGIRKVTPARMKSELLRRDQPVKDAIRAKKNQLKVEYRDKKREENK